MALGFSILLAISERPTVLALGLAIAVGMAAAARLPVGPSLRRMGGVNVFMLLLVVLLPLSVPGSPVFQLGPLAFSEQGLRQALMIALRANAIVLVITALVSTIDLTALGHALHHLKLPAKLVSVLLLCVRYIDVFRHEYLRLRRAMNVRAFHPRVNRHTYRTMGYLVGMLLVRSFDRSERVLAAMRCRGFQGRFHMIDHFVMKQSDVMFGIGALLPLGVLAWMEWA